MSHTQVGTIHQTLRALDEDARVEALGSILRRASLYGFRGFGGLCGQAAVAINRVLFDGEGVLVGGFNVYFAEVLDQCVGHIVVADHEGWYWDADGRAKDADDVESWGMLAPDDPDWAEKAEGLGGQWSEARAEEAGMFELTEDEVLERLGSDRVAAFEDALRSAVADWRVVRGVD